jgi:hypothetical protein
MAVRHCVDVLMCQEMWELRNLGINVYAVVLSMVE